MDSCPSSTTIFSVDSPSHQGASIPPAHHEQLSGPGTSDLSIILIWTFFLISSVATHNPATPEPIILTFIK